MYEIHFKQFDITKNKSYEIIGPKLWKEQKKESKIDYINDCREYYQKTINKRNKYMWRTGFAKKEAD